MYTHSHTKQAQWGVVKKYCFACPNKDDMAGNRAFDKMSPDNIAADAETWERAIRKLRSGLMPPAGKERTAPQYAPALVSWLETEIDDKADASAAPGRVSLPRLNRRE